jgi:sugar phosphate isomerase/epimerase
VGQAIELMNLYWSNAGLPLGSGEISPFSFEERVKSAARAGFTGIGLWHTDLEHICVLHPLRDVKAILDDNGIKHVELEFLTDWFVDGARRAESDSRKRRLLAASAAIGAHHVKVGDFYNTPCTMPRLIDSFAALCREADDYGATVGFEFMSSAMIHTLAGSLEMVAGAGARNGGLIIDIAHTVALGISNEDLSLIPAKYLVNVELNDNWLPSTPGYDPAQRRFCGEGEFDIQGFIAAIASTGYAGQWALEVFSGAVDGWPLDRLNAKGYRTTSAQFRD